MEKSDKTLQRLERLRQLNSKGEWVNDVLYRLMYKEDLYIVAYERIKSKPGNMTPGTDGATLDGWSLQMTQSIIAEMRSEQFQFKPVRTEYIPKTSKKSGDGCMQAEAAGERPDRLRFVEGQVDPSPRLTPSGT